MNAANEKTYTKEQLDIAILQNTNLGMVATLQRIETKLDTSISKLDAKIDKLDVKLDTNMNRLDTKIDKLDAKLETNINRLDSKLDKFDSKLDSHFKWSLGLIFGLYALGIGTSITLVCKAYKLF